MKSKTPKKLRSIESAARRSASIREHGGTGVWRPRAARFPDRKKTTNRRACRGKVPEET
jgi:hypothetical protein